MSNILPLRENYILIFIYDVLVMAVLCFYGEKHGLIFYAPFNCLTRVFSNDINLKCIPLSNPVNI